MNAATETPTYYERWGPVGRRVLRAGHRFRFAAKRSLGLQPRILVEIKWRLGDEVMALPIYEALRTRYPSAHIEVLCNFPELLEDNPFVDVVNSETPSPDRYFLLREAARVAGKAIILKDHRLSRPLAGPTLRFMDWIGNRPHGVALPYNYWPLHRWREAWAALGLNLDHYQTRIGLYPGPARWLFEHGLHFVARLTPDRGTTRPETA